MRTERRGMHGWVTLPTIERTQTTKRLKHCVTNPAHIWANPMQKDGSGFANTSAWNSIKNWYFKTSNDGTRVIHSYRDSYILGSRFEHKNKAVFLLREGKGWSVTTSQQMSATRAAVPKSRNVEVFTVPAMVNYYDHTKPGKKEHASNVQAYLTNIKLEIDEFNRARASYRIRGARNRAVELLAELKRYAKVFGLRLPKLPQVPKINPAKMRQILAKEKTRDAAQAERRRLQQEAYERAHQAEVEAWKTGPDRCQHLNAEGQPIHEFRDRWTCQQQREREEWERDKAELVQRWRVGENVTLKFAYSEPAILRVKDGKVETSHRADVAILGQAGAARLWGWLKALKDAGRVFQRNGVSRHIGHFTVESFDGKILHVGCHRIAWEECERIAPQVLAYEAERGEIQQTEVQP